MSSLRISEGDKYLYFSPVFSRPFTSLSDIARVLRTHRVSSGGRRLYGMVRSSLVLYLVLLGRKKIKVVSL